MTIQATSTSIIRKQQLYASVIRRCDNCGAPGFWHNTPGVNVGCYAPEKVTELGKDFVGLVCPNCGADRAPVEYLGKIWEKIWRVGLMTVLRELLQEKIYRLQSFLQRRKT